MSEIREDIVDVEVGSDLPVDNNTPVINQPDEPTERDLASINTITAPEKNEVNVEEMVTPVIKTAVAQADVGTKAALNVATFVPGIAEDIYNFGVDVINFADTKFGDGKNLIQYSDMISRWQPEDTASVMVRESAKLMIGYSAALKGIKAFAPDTLAKMKYVPEAASGFIAEMGLLKPQGEPLLKQFFSKVPVLNEWMDYMHAGEDDTGLERRLRNSLYGVVEGEIVSGLMKVAKHMRSIYKTQADVPEVDTNVTPNNTEVIEPPPIPEEALLQGSIKPTEVDKVKANEMLVRYLKKEGNPNIAEVGPDNYLDMTSFNVDDDSRKLIDLVVQSNKESFAKISMDDPALIQAARDMNMTPEKLLEFEVEAGFPRGTILAAQSVVNEAAGSIKVLAKKYLDGEIDQSQWTQAVVNFRELTAKTKDMRSLAGALLRETQTPVGVVNNTQKIKELTRIFNENPDTLAKEIARPESRVERIVQGFKQHGNNVADALTQIRYAGLLSSPLTHMRNIYGGVTTTLARPAESILAATINATAGRNNPIGVTFGEGYHELMGMGQGFMEALQITSKKLRGQDGADFLGVNPEHAKLPQYLAENQPEALSKGGKAVNFMKEILGNSAIGKALQLEDNFIKHINARMTINREAYIKGHRAKINGASKEEVAEIMRNELANPSQGTLNKMYADAEYVTFTNDVKGTVFKSLETASKTPLGRLVAPFAKVNLNVMSYTLERIPGANLMLERSRQELFSVDPAIRQRAVSKMAFASTTMGALAAYLHGQDAIIGDATSNPAKRKFLEQHGYQTGSIKVGDSWVEYRKETPIGSILNFMANMAELRDALPKHEGHVIDELGTFLVSTVAQLYNPEYLTNSIASLGDVFADPSSEAGKAGMKFISDIGTSFLPYSAVSRQMHRTFGSGEKGEVFTPASLLDSTINQVKDIYAPYLNARKRNLFGDPIIHKQGLGPDIISPFGLTPETKDPVLQEVARLSDISKFSAGATGKIKMAEGSLVEQRDLGTATFSMPPKTFTDPTTLQVVKLGTDDYEKFVILSSGRDFNETKNGVEPAAETSNSLRPVLNKVISSSSYKELSDMDKAAQIRGIINDYRKIARMKMIHGKGNFAQEYKQIFKNRMEEIKMLRQ